MHEAFGRHVREHFCHLEHNAQCRVFVEEVTIIQVLEEGFPLHDLHA